MPLHDLRHRCVRDAVMNGVPVPVVARLLGHSNVCMTLRHAHLGELHIAAAAERAGQAIVDQAMTGLEEADSRQRQRSINQSPGSGGGSAPEISSSS